MLKDTQEWDTIIGKMQVSNPWMEFLGGSINSSRVSWDKKEFIDFEVISQNITRGRDPRG